MEDSPCRRQSLVMLIATCVLVVNVGCSGPPPSVISLNSSTAAQNQRFDEQLIGTWAAFIKEEPYVIITVTRDADVPKTYSFKMNDPEDPEGVAEDFGRMRLLSIGDCEFMELEYTMSQVAPANERVTVDGEPLRTLYNLWRVTRTRDALQVWGFENTQILETLPTSEIVPSVPQGKNMTIANCSTDDLQKFLLKNGSKMTRKAEDFKRFE